MSPMIRIDDEVARVIRQERRPCERNFNAAIWRLIERHEAGVYDSPEAAPSAGGDPESVLPSTSGTV